MVEKLATKRARTIEHSNRYWQNLSMSEHDNMGPMVAPVINPEIDPDIGPTALGITNRLVPDKN